VFQLQTETVKSELLTRLTEVVIVMKTFFLGKLTEEHSIKIIILILSLTTNFVTLSDGGATQERLQDAVHQRDEDEASVDDNVNNDESKSGSDD
jgi:hypothetical protein